MTGSTGPENNSAGTMTGKRRSFTSHSPHIPPRNMRAAERRIVHKRQPLVIAPFQFEAFAIDISPNGLGIISKSYVPTNAQITIEILGKLIPARVAWCSGIPTTGRILKPDGGCNWRMGLELQPETDDQKAFLKELVDNL